MKIMANLPLTRRCDEDFSTQRFFTCVYVCVCAHSAGNFRTEKTAKVFPTKKPQSFPSVFLKCFMTFGQFHRVEQVC